MNPTITAIQLLGTFSPHFDIYALAGDRNGKIRQALNLALTGEKLPISQCGVNALTSRFHMACGVTGSCIAAREDAFVNYCRVAIL